MAKHYVKLNEKNEIIAGFSDEFDIGEPLEELVLINEDGDRHFRIDGSPELINGQVYIYTYKNGEVKRKTDKAIQKEQEAIDSARVVEPTEVAKLNVALLEMGEMVAVLAEQVEQIGG